MGGAYTSLKGFSWAKTKDSNKALSKLCYSFMKKKHENKNNGQAFELQAHKVAHRSLDGHCLII